MKACFVVLMVLLTCLQLSVLSGDFTGDGTDDIAIYRPSSGLWAIRGVTRSYYGREGDVPLPGDYTGDGKAGIAIFRPATGLWAIKNITRAYFGAAGDIALSSVGITFNPRQFYLNPVTGNLGISNPNPSVGVEVGSWPDSGRDVIFHGTNSAGSSRMIWDQEQAALRVGVMALPSGWEVEPGEGSLSVGRATTAQGAYSVAIGEGSGTTGGMNLAVGYASSASNICSVASGWFALARGNYSLAHGYLVGANAENAIVIGRGSTEGGSSDSTFPNHLFNNHTDSLMVGFNTTTDPALFVDSHGVGVGTTRPARKLHVNNVIRLEPRNEAPSNPARGDMYYDATDDILKVYNGTTWRDCF